MLASTATHVSAQTKTATTTTLAATSGGAAVTSVPSGTVVTLTATVKTGSTAITTGQVEFCDASAKSCTDIHALGLAQLTNAGTATMNFRPGIGSHSYKAMFLGTNTYAASASGASALTVTSTPGPIASSTTVTESGSWGNYTLAAAVTEAGRTIAPTGIVSFLDTSNGNAVLATQTLGAAVAGVGWPNPQTINVGSNRTELVADLNGDGIADLVVDANSLLIYLGNADGTYTEAPVPSYPGPASGPMVIAGLNGDGIPDLAVAIYAYSSVSIFLGHGDGTFAAPLQTSLPTAGANISQLVTADFNGDGIADLIAVDNSDSALYIFLGNGDGTFTQGVSPSISIRPSGVAIGDFNGDGKTDFAVADSYSDTITLLLGNGDGTFTTGATIHSGTVGAESGGLQIAAADFNGDGKLDLVVAAGGFANVSESVTLITGNGDGTFHSPVLSQSATSSAVTWIQVADFNQDGTPDVVLADSNGNVSLLLNNGSGSFSGSIPVVTGLSVPYFLTCAVGDLNGDGYPDIVAGGYYTSKLGLFLTEPTETATASSDISLPAGLHQVDASYAGDTANTGSVSGAIPVWGTPLATTTNLSATSGGTSVTSVAPGTEVTLTATVMAGSNPVAAGQVNFCDATATYCTDVHILGTATLTSNGSAIFKFVPGSGTHRYKAVLIENGYGASSSSNVISLTVGQAPSPVYNDTTAISFNGSPGDFSLTATVVGYGGTTPPTGNVSFLDTNFGNTTLATAPLSSSAPGLGWQISQTPSLPYAPSGEVQGDFNGDGIPDLAVIESADITVAADGPYSVNIFFGTGNGTFTTDPTTTTTAIQGSPYMITGDFNGDGKTDLAILSVSLGANNSTVTVLLGNGDGTFAAPLTSQAYNQGVEGGDIVPGSMVAADFNGDGKTDLAAVGALVASGEVTILLGKGDGTFTSSGSSYGYSSSFNAIATGDFNGDHIPDLVVSNYFGPSGAIVLLGKGDGNFTAEPTQIPVDTFAHSIQVGDFNSDGVVDLAFGHNSAVGVYLGNGDGTFTATPASPISGSGLSLVTGDFNHDGKLDLAGIDTYNDQIDIFTGAGDGTFKEIVTTPNVSVQTVGSDAIVAADFNSDGVPDLALVDGIDDSASILLTEPTETATATTSGLAPFGAGTHNVDASYAGDSNYPSSVSPTVALTAGLAPLTFSPGGGAYLPGQQVTIGESVPGAAIYYQASGGLNTDGFVPYTGPISFSQIGSETIQAYATETGYEQSEYASTTYTVSATPIGTAVATVSVTPSVTNLTNAQTLTVAVLVSGATGQPAPTGSVTLSGDTWSEQQTLPGGSATFTVPPGTLSAGGNTLTAAYSGDTTYAVASGTASVTVSSVVSTAQTPSAISPGSSASSTISFSGSSTYSGTMNLSCALTSSPTGAQNLPTCSMKPTSVTLTPGSNSTSMLTVETTGASTTALLHPFGGPLQMLDGGGVALAMVLMFGIPARRRRWVSLFALLLAIFAIGSVGCGGGAGSGGGGGGGGQTTPATSAGTYTFTVTGTDSANVQITASTTVVVTVQ